MKKDWWNMHRITLLVIGSFLLLDGLLSVYFGNSCLYRCYNNSHVGNIVRIIRAAIGFYLIYVGSSSKLWK